MVQFPLKPDTKRRLLDKESIKAQKSYILTVFPHQRPGHVLVNTGLDKNVGKTMDRKNQRARRETGRDEHVCVSASLVCACMCA